MQMDCIDEGSGDAVVLIHSGASNNRQWKSLIEALRGDFRVLAPNLHGVGGTPAWPEGVPYSLADAAALVETLCEGIPGRLSLVGHSVGGAWAMQAAAQLGSRVDRLVLLEAAPYDLLRQAGWHDPYREARALYEFVGEGTRRGAWRAISERFLEAFVGPGTWAGMSEERRERVELSMRNNRTQWDSLMNDRTSLDEWKRRLPRSTLYVSAADTWRPLRELARLLAEGDTGWKFAAIPEGGHMAPLYRPELVNPLAVRFLRGR